MYVELTYYYFLIKYICINISLFLYILCIALVAGYVGQTQGLVKAKLDEAIGGVLFIDEAHRLKPSKYSFKDEALGVIISATTNPIYQNKLLIVLAGYTQEINDLLNCDQGLKRRFSKHIEFKNIQPINACLLLRNILQKAGYSLDETITNEILESFFHELSLRPGFGNIGDINELFIDLKAISARRLGQEYNEKINNAKNNFHVKREQYFLSWKRNFILSDVEIAMKQFLERRPYDPQEISPNNITIMRNDGDKEEDEGLIQYDDTIFEPSIKQPYNINKTIQMKEKTTLHQKQEIKEEEEDKEQVNEQENNEKKHSNQEKKLTKQDKRIVLDILNTLFQQSFQSDLNQLNQFFIQGSMHSKYQEISQESVKLLQQSSSSSSLKSQSIETLQEIISQTIHEWQEIYAKHDEYETNETKFDNIQQQLQSIAMNIDEQNHIDELEKQKQEEIKRKLEEELRALETEKRRIEQSMIVICGVCGRENSPYSGCGYRGNSPKPIKILKQDMLRYNM